MRRRVCDLGLVNQGRSHVTPFEFPGLDFGGIETEREGWGDIGLTSGVLRVRDTPPPDLSPETFPTGTRKVPT